MSDHAVPTLGARATIVRANDRAYDEQVLALLALASEINDPFTARDVAERAAQDYATRDAFDLWALVEGGTVLGIIGIETRDDGQVVLRDLAVSPRARRRGVGRALIDFVRGEVACKAIRGHTAAGATAFYVRCGFVIREEGLTKVGERRYLFEWSA